MWVIFFYQFNNISASSSTIVKFLNTLSIVSLIRKWQNWNSMGHRLHTFLRFPWLFRNWVTKMGINLWTHKWSGSTYCFCSVCKYVNSSAENLALVCLTIRLYFVFCDLKCVSCPAFYKHISSFYIFASSGLHHFFTFCQKKIIFWW